MSDHELDRIVDLNADQREVVLVVLAELWSTAEQLDDAVPADYAADIIRKLGRDYLPGTEWTMEEAL